MSQNLYVSVDHVYNTSADCEHSQQQTMNNIVDMCLLTECEGGLLLLLKTETNARKWL